MRRLVSDLCFAAALWLGAFLISSLAQAQFNSFPPGAFSNKAALDPAPGGGGYTGPGDVVSGAKAYWGLRCYNNAYNGNMVDIVDNATGNTTGARLQCATGNVITALVSASSCTFVTGNACSSVAIVCAIACRTVTFYDQSGANACGGSNCDVTMATNTNRFQYFDVGSANCTTTSFPCIRDVNGAQCLQSTNAITLAQPFSMVSVANHRADSGTLSAILGASSSTVFSMFRNSAGVVGMASPTLVTTSGVTEAAWHSMQFIFNGASSSLNADGSGSGSVNAGATGFSAENLQLGEWASSAGACGTNSGRLTLEEQILYGVALSGGQITSLNSNAHTYWGF